MNEDSDDISFVEEEEEEDVISQLRRTSRPSDNTDASAEGADPLLSGINISGANSWQVTAAAEADNAGSGKDCLIQSIPQRKSIKSTTCSLVRWSRQPAGAGQVVLLLHMCIAAASYSPRVLHQVAAVAAAVVAAAITLPRPQHSSVHNVQAA